MMSVCAWVWVCAGNQSQPPLQGRQGKGKSWEIMKHHQIPFVGIRNVTRGRWGVSRRAVDEMCQPLWAGCWRHSVSSQGSRTIPASPSAAFPLLFWTELFLALFLPPAHTDGKILHQNAYTDKAKKRRERQEKRSKFVSWCLKIGGLYRSHLTWISSLGRARHLCNSIASLSDVQRESSFWAMLTDRALHLTTPLEIQSRWVPTGSRLWDVTKGRAQNYLMESQNGLDWTCFNSQGTPSLLRAPSNISHSSFIFYESATFM